MIIRNRGYQFAFIFSSFSFLVLVCAATKIKCWRTVLHCCMVSFIYGGSTKSRLRCACWSVAAYTWWNHCWFLQRQIYVFSKYFLMLLFFVFCLFGWSIFRVAILFSMSYGNNWKMCVTITLVKLTKLSF